MALLNALSASPAISPTLEHALFYARLGWSVVPSHKITRGADGKISCSCPAGVSCVSKGKHPAVGWTRWQTERADEAQIQLWFTGAFVNYGVGIITGAISRMFVVDIDEAPGKDGPGTIQNLQMIYGDLPVTVTARTGGGGRHLIFAHPCDGTWINTAKNVFGPGVDVRGDGGFIVAAPSLHESGRYYLWDETAHPRTTAIAIAPVWLIELAETPPPQPGVPRGPSTGTGEIIRDAWGKITDGRERYMVGIVCGVIASMTAERGALPDVEAVLAEAWPTYERNVRARGASLDDDNRGQGLMRQRIGHFLRRAASGKWRVATDRQTDDKPREDDQTKPRGGKSIILSLEEMENLPPPEWLVEGLFPERGLIVPYGPPKGGKTFIVLSIALHIAAGLPWFGHEVRGGGVVYIAGEGVGGLGMRTKAIRKHHGIGLDIPFWVIRRAINFTQPTAATDLIKLIRDTVLDEPIAMVVVDTLARAMPGAEENSAKEVGLVIAACADVQEALECAVVPIHHQGKDASRGARGTSALRGAWDAALEITKTGDRVNVLVADQKDAEAGQRLQFRMEKVSVSLSKTSLVPVLIEGGAGTDEEAEPETQRDVGGQAGIAIQVLRNLIASPESAILPPLSGMPTGDIRGVDISVWRRAFYDKNPALAVKAREKAFLRAVETLTKRNFIGARTPWVWLA